MNRWPDSIREINQLPEAEKLAIYRTLLPEWLFHEYGIRPDETPTDGYPLVTFRCPGRSRALEIRVKRRITDMDLMMYLNMADTFNNQILVLLVVVNDPDAPRYNTDIDQQGNQTQFGTISRNIPAELEAMAAGLSPGQIRKGLRVFRQSVPIFETFISNMGHDMFLIEPLAYHNAILFERYGFNYLKGHQEMVAIDTGFRPGGRLHAKLTPDNPFRHPTAWKTVRGRSWAIHDGILGHPYTGFQMYKRVGVDANVNTFPDITW